LPFVGRSAADGQPLVDGMIEIDRHIFLSCPNANASQTHPAGNYTARSRRMQEEQRSAG